MRFRYALSILASAGLWTLLPVTLGFLNYKLTPHGRDLFLRELPITIGASFLFFVPLAAVMHWLWVPATRKAAGLSFWLLPLRTLPTAYVLGSLLLLPIAITKERFWVRPIDEYGGGLLFMFVVYAFVLLVSAVWIVYPLALVNQYIVCSLLRNKNEC